MHLAVLLEVQLTTACDIEHYHVVATYGTGFHGLLQTGQRGTRGGAASAAPEAE